MTAVPDAAEVTPATEHVERLLALGEPGRHPAGAVVGVRSAAGTQVRAAGWATLPAAGARGVPMAPGTWLDWASVTKVAVTTVLVLRLADRGDLALADPVARFLPGFRAPGADRARLEDLLTHTAGLRPWWPLYCETTDRDDALARVQAMPLQAAPGTAHAYSDLGPLLAGLVVERVTGLGLADALRDLVTRPLSLALRYGPVPPDRAATSADSDVVEQTMVATGRPYPVPAGGASFAGWRRGPVRGEANDGNAAHALGGVAGHAGAFGPVADLLTLGAALCDGTLVHPDLLGAVARPGIGRPAQAVGFRRVERPGPDGRGVTWLWHGGFTGTCWALEPRSGTVVAGGATRLHGTTGPLPGSAADADPLRGVATGEEIARVLVDAGTRALTGEGDQR